MEQALFADRGKYRDPNRPKNPRNAYMMFVQSARKQIRTGMLKIECSGALGETSKHFGRTWKAMPEHEKEVIPFLFCGLTYTFTVRSQRILSDCRLSGENFPLTF